MKLILVAFAALTMLAGTAVAAEATTPAPVVTVTPSHGLVAGKTVHVSGTGITASASVQVVQCDTYVGDPEQDCPTLTTTTASATGAVALKVKVASLVYRSEPFGDSTPIYCRGDDCRIFLAWTDQDGNPQSASSPALEFKGAPARIHARPATNLKDSQTIRVNGRAYGAFGHRILVLEEACYGIIQGSGCYGALPAVTSWIKPNGTFVVNYPASRYLSDGTDCASDQMLGQCEMSVIVMNHGQPDDSFGVSSIGQPAAFLTFLGSPATS